VVWHNAEILYFRGRPAAWTGMSRVTTCVREARRKGACSAASRLDTEPPLLTMTSASLRDCPHDVTCHSKCYI